MAWHYRDPMTFPALFHNTILEAAKIAPKPVLFREVATRDEAKNWQEKFRHFKWCAAHERSAATETRRAVEAYDFRCTFEVVSFKLLLYVRARPGLIADLTSLNPDLAKELSHIVNP